MQVVSRGVSETGLPRTWKGVTVNNQVRPDILLIVLDTLRADRLSCYGYERDTCPHLDAFAEQGVLYEPNNLTACSIFLTTDTSKGHRVSHTPQAVHAEALTESFS